MITFIDGVKYLGLAAIIYFLLKSFVNDKLSNTQILIIVISIMVLVIFIIGQNSECSKRRKEGFETSQTNNEVIVDTEPNSKEPEEIDYNQNAVLRDIAVFGLDKNRYEKILADEKEAMDKIKSGYQNEMIYTQTHPFNTVPLGSRLYGYTFLPPENWFRAYERPPVCITDKKCTVCPMNEPSTAGLLEFDSANNTMGPMGIDTNYISKVLNKEN